MGELFESFRDHVSFGYVASVIASAFALALSFSFGTAFSANGFIEDTVFTAWVFLVLLLAFSLALFFLCELIARFNDSRRRRRRALQNLRREAKAKARAVERTERIRMRDELRQELAQEEFELTGRMPRVRERAAEPENPSWQVRLDRLAPKPERKSVAVFAAVMLAFWTPYMAALFPGSMNWDTFYQIATFEGKFPVYVIPWIDTNSIVDAWVSDHHPLFDTLVYGAFATASLDLTGSWSAGVFCFCLIQCALTALAFTGAVAYLRHVGAHPAVRFGAYALYCLMPFFPMYGMTMLKDSTHAMLFVPYLVMLAEIVRTRGQVLKDSRKAAGWFFALGILLVLTKKTGLYVVAPTCLVLAFAFRGAWKHFALQAGCAVAIIYVLFPLVVFPALNVVPGGVQEPLNWMFQQTARYAVVHGDEVTDAERAAIDAVIPYDTLAQNYVYDDADTVKARYRYDTATSADLAAYVATWAEMGLKHPETYVQSLLCVASPYFNGSGVMGVHGQTGDGVDKAAAPYISQPAALDGYRSAVLGAYEGLVGAPLLCVLFRVGPYAAWVPLLAWCYFCRRGGGRSLLMLPVLLALASCLFTPIFHARYALPLVYAAPFLLGMLFSLGFASFERRRGVVMGDGSDLRADAPGESFRALRA